MKKFLNFLSILLLMISGILLLCMIVKADPGLANGILVGKICWFHTSVFCLACSVLVMELTVSKSRFTFSLPDGLLLSLFGILLFTYDKEANLQPEKLLFYGQLMFVWFLLRAVIQTYPDLKVFYLMMIMISGMVEAVWGMFHFYGNGSFVHPLLNEIDFSFRAGPLSGYLAVVLPVCLNMVLRFHNCSKTAWWEPRTGLYYFSWISLLVILVALIGSLNRPAWIAAVLSCSWVGWMRMIGWEKTKRKIRRNQIRLAFSSFVLLMALTGFLELGEKLKDGFPGDRLLMWNVTTKAILEHPFLGTGLGSYPAVYARVQHAYLASGKASVDEVRSASFPAFAYNEYLHIGLELGSVGLVLFMLGIGFSIYYGIKHRQIGSCGGILAMGSLAMFSYPLQLPSFWILLVFFTVICTTGTRIDQEFPQKSYPYVGALAALFACVLFLNQKDMPETYRKWRELEVMREKDKNRTWVTEYRNLYPRLCHCPDFLKQGAACLSEAGEYSQAVIWLERAMQLSADPDLYEQMVFNKKKLGKHGEAAKYWEFLHPDYTASEGKK